MRQGRHIRGLLNVATVVTKRYRGHFSLGLSSLVIQIATYVLLLSFKIQATDTEFVSAIKQIAIVSILASIASFKLELVLFQAHRGTFLRTLVIPMLAATIGLSAVYFLIGPLIAWLGFGNPLMTVALPLGLALATQEVQNFFCVQEKKWSQMIGVRFGQAGCLVALAFATHIVPDSHAFLLYYGMALLLPLLIWVLIFLLTSAHGCPDPSLSSPFRERFRRAAALTLTQLVSTIYVHVANLLSISIQSPAQSADFTFLSRIATGPITLIRQVLGQLFLAQCLRLESEGSATRKNVLMHMRRVVAYSSVVYAIFSALCIPIVYHFQDALNIEHPSMLYPLFFVGILQLAVSQAGFSRFILHEDVLFLIAEICRLLVLTLLLTVLEALEFPVRFAMASGVVYGGYFLFLLHRLDVRLPSIKAD